MKEAMLQYFRNHPDTPPIGISGDYRCSVHFGNKYRIDKAKEQISLSPMDTGTIIAYVNAFLQAIGMQTVKSPIVHNPLRMNYEKLKATNNLAAKDDIVWMKFTEDGYLGVVAVSADINFDIPQDVSEYDLKVWDYDFYSKQRKRVWKHNSPGILVHQLGKKWDSSFALVFPLADIPEGYRRGDIERAIGNYLIERGVPIIDFFSHNY